MELDFTQFVLNDVDNAGFPAYFGYIDADGRWYIEKRMSDGTRRYSMSYVSPRGQYSSSWNNRVNLVYTYWDTSF